MISYVEDQNAYKNYFIITEVIHKTMEGLPILNHEVENAIIIIKYDKAPGSDNNYVETLMYWENLALGK